MWDSKGVRAFAVLSPGEGSLVISHANNAYFWVISTFSKLCTDVLLRLYTPVTAVMGVVAQLLIWGLYLLG